MRNLRQRERTSRPGDWQKEGLKIQDSIHAIEVSDEEFLQILASDPLSFCKDALHFEPTDYQDEAIRLFEENQFIALRWCRQSGKSLTVSALLLYHALTHPNSSIAVVGPSWRQTKFNIRRMAGLLENVWGDRCFKPRRTGIHFKNGSTIEAYPNNPETIRGPTLDIVWWDEVNFTPNDAELYDAILFTLGATNGKLIASSTPWNSDSLFWKMCNHEDYSDFARHHVPCSRAVEPNGPLKQNILSKIKKQFAEDPSRWKREMQAEWAEDDDVWLPQSLIVKCIGTEKTCGKDLEMLNPEVGHRGAFFAGLDFAKHSDYTVLCVVEQLDGKLFLRFWKTWKLETTYASIIGYVKILQDRWDGFQKVKADQTGTGDYIVEGMKNSGIKNVEGVMFTPQRKQEMASLLKERMMNGQYFFPYFTWETPYRSEYVAELNVERYKLNKDGTTKFSHPTGTHDDTFWATALAVSATTETKIIDQNAFKLR
jgi:phage FluMu gp28-like protein